MAIRKFLPALLITVIVQNAVCQESYKNSLMAGVRSHYGFIIAHSRELKDVSHTFPWGVETELAWQFMGDKAWQYCYCYPRAGVSFFYTNFDNPDVLGSSWALYVFVEPMIGAENRISGSVRFGGGPNYLDKVYDEETNPENKFYSSPVSFIVMLNAGLNYRINKFWNVRLAGNFNHISNGGIKNPNKGINFPTFNLGVDYNLRPLPYTNKTKNDSILINPWKKRTEISFFSTAKTDIKGQERYLVYGFMGKYSRVTGRLSALSLGLEWASDGADKKEIERNGIMTGGKPADHRYAAFLLGHDLLLGDFNFSVQLGVYVYSPFDRMDEVYQRYGISYHFTGMLFCGINLKAHRHVADFFDFRLGVSF